MKNIEEQYEFLNEILWITMELHDLADQLEKAKSLKAQKECFLKNISTAYAIDILKGHSTMTSFNLIHEMSQTNSYEEIGKLIEWSERFCNQQRILNQQTPLSLN